MDLDSDVSKPGSGALCSDSREGFGLCPGPVREEGSLVLVGLAIKQWFLSLPRGEPDNRTEEERVTLLQLFSSLARQTHCSLFMPPGPDCAWWAEEGGGNLCLWKC